MTLLKIVSDFFQDDLWWENNSEEFSSENENINDIHPDVDNNNDNVEPESEIGQWILRNKINWTTGNELLDIFKKKDMKNYLTAAGSF